MPPAYYVPFTAPWPLFGHSLLVVLGPWDSGQSRTREAGPCRLTTAAWLAHAAVVALLCRPSPSPTSPTQSRLGTLVRAFMPSFSNLILPRARIPF